MNDRWKSARAHKDDRIADTGKALAGSVQRWDDEIRLARVWMIEKLVELGSWEALRDWMKSDEAGAVEFRQYVDRTGHRWHVTQLYLRLKDADIEQLKTQAV